MDPSQSVSPKKGFPSVKSQCPECHASGDVLTVISKVQLCFLTYWRYLLQISPGLPWSRQICLRILTGILLNYADRANVEVEALQCKNQSVAHHTKSNRLGKQKNCTLLSSSFYSA